jgi:hypothetical protein
LISSIDNRTAWTTGVSLIDMVPLSEWRMPTRMTGSEWSLQRRADAKSATTNAAAKIPINQERRQIVPIDELLRSGVEAVGKVSAGHAE